MSIVSRNIRKCSRALRSNVYMKNSGIWTSYPVLLLRYSSNNYDSSQSWRSLKLLELSDFIQKNGTMSNSQIHGVLSDLEHEFSVVPFNEYVILVNDIWNKIENSGSSLTNSHYNSLLKLYMKTNIEFNPESFLMHMLKKDIGRNLETYEIICKQLLSTNQAHKLSVVVDFIKKSEVLLSQDTIFLILSNLIQKGDTATAECILDSLKDMCRTELDRYGLLMCDLLSRGDQKLSDFILMTWRSDLSSIANLIESLFNSNSMVLNEILQEIKCNFSDFELDDLFKKLIAKDCFTDITLFLHNYFHTYNISKIIKILVNSRKHPHAIIKFLEDYVDLKEANFQALVLVALKSSLAHKYYELSLELLNVWKAKDFALSDLQKSAISKAVDIPGLLMTNKTTKTCQLDCILLPFDYKLSEYSPEVILHALGSVYDTTSACSLTEFFLQQGDLQSATKFVKYCGQFAPAVGMSAIKSLSDNPSYTTKPLELVDFIFASAVQLLWYDQVLETFTSNPMERFLDENSIIVLSNKERSTDWTEWKMLSGKGREYLSEILCLIGKLQNDDFSNSVMDGYLKYGLGLKGTAVENSLEFHEVTMSNKLKQLTKTSLSNLSIPFNSEVLQNQKFCEVDKKQWLQRMSNHVFSLAELNSILKEVHPRDFVKLALPSHLELAVRLQYLLRFGYTANLQEKSFSWSSESDKPVYTLALCISMVKNGHPGILELLKSLPDIELSDTFYHLITSYLIACKTGIIFEKSIEILEEKLPAHVKDSIWWKVLSKDMTGAIQNAEDSLSKSGTCEHLKMLTAALCLDKLSCNTKLPGKLFNACLKAKTKFYDCTSLNQFLITVFILYPQSSGWKKIFRQKLYPDLSSSFHTELAELGENDLNDLAKSFIIEDMNECGAHACTQLLQIYRSLGEKEKAKSLVLSMEHKHCSRYPFYQQEVFMTFGGAQELHNRIELLLEKGLDMKAESLLTSVPLTSPFILRLMMCCFLNKNTSVFNFLRKPRSGFFLYYSDAIYVTNNMERIVLGKLWNVALHGKGLEIRNEGLLYALASLIRSKHPAIDELAEELKRKKTFLLAHLFWKAYICVGNETSAAEMASLLSRWQCRLSNKLANFSSYIDVVAEKMDLEELETHMYFLEKYDCQKSLHRAKTLYILALAVKNEHEKLLAIHHTLDGLPLDELRRMSQCYLLAEQTRFRAVEYITSILADRGRWHKTSNTKPTQ